METNLNSNKIIVGFNTGHNGSCTILRNNDLISISEERLNRKKYSDGYMYSFVYCLKELGININDIDLFVSSSYGEYLPKDFTGDFEKILGDKSNSKFISVDHHLSHAYSTYFMSPFNEAIVVVIDGQGNLNSTESYYIASKEKIEYIGGNDLKRSKYKGIGRTYETFTNYCGWSAQEAGKTMGLASYGTDKYPEIELYDINDNLEISSRCDGKYGQASYNFCKENNLDFNKMGMGYDNKDAAYFVQDRTEKILIELIKRLYDKYKIKNLCLAGGVFLNGIINNKILKETEIENIFIPPFCDDTGQSVGNVLYGYYNFYNGKNRFELKNAYFGKEYNEEEILDVLNKEQKIFILPYEVKSNDFKFKKSYNIAKDVAEILATGKIVGWFQGGSEIGPRALGHRSILCAPFPREMKDTLNQKIKHRELFRPFAPAILEEKVKEYFDIDILSPFMLNVAKVKKEKINSIPATLHVDNTGRLQTVNKKDNGIFYDLIYEFYKKTNIPVLLNTSFNDNGEPIVETPKDAIIMFCKAPMDYLVLNDYIIWKNDILK